jgi:transcriptional regulator with XRE-family HTH domain
MHDDDDLGRLIREAREAKGWSQTRLGDEFEISRNAVSNWEHNKNLPKGERLLKLGTVLDSRTLAALTNITPVGNYDESIATGRLSVKGEVKPWAWLEIDRPKQDYGTVPIVPNDRFAGVPQFAYRIADKPGEYVIVASWPELERSPMVGDCLLIRRERSKTFETTIRRVRKGNSGLELWPDTPDQRQQPIPLTEKAKDVAVRIVGLVIGKYIDNY